MLLSGACDSLRTLDLADHDLGTNDISPLALQKVAKAAACRGVAGVPVAVAVAGDSKSQHQQLLASLALVVLAVLALVVIEPSDAWWRMIHAITMAASR